MYELAQMPGSKTFAKGISMYRIAKRFIDIFIASLALLLLAPIIIPCMLILRFTGEREVFFLQKRIGYRNRPFYIWKFATMLKDSPNIGTGEITLRNDPRVTRFGRFLRMTKLNELPQIFNVLKGDMSIVGPRPLMEVSFRLYSEEVRKKIYNSKPGITGIGSLVFRDEEKIVSGSPDPRFTYANLIYPHKATLELWYQRNASLYTDSMIILLTGLSILYPANKLTEKVFRDLPANIFA